MSETAGAIVLAALVLSTSIWVGGYVAIAVVARTATVTLHPTDRIAFFRQLGRTYLWIGLPALAVALLTGAVLVHGREWDALLVSTTVIAVVLVASLAVAVAQARRMTVLRRALLDSPQDGQLTELVRRGGRAAGALRGLLGLLSIALVVLGAFLAV